MRAIAHSCASRFDDVRQMFAKRANTMQIGVGRSSGDVIMRDGGANAPVDCAFVDSCRRHEMICVVLRVA